MTDAQLLLGDEAVAYGAMDGGVGACYGYPGTPSTEILETILRHEGEGTGLTAAWCVNEKTALEQALGAVLVGRRALVTMKHVGLNVAADPFLNASLLDLHAGLVVAVADDPGMASSQNEQDSRFYGEFARVICLEPADQQEAYDMARRAFALSEALHVPVLLRLVTRLAHSRSPVFRNAVDEPRPIASTGPEDGRTEASGGREASGDSEGWTLVPSNARRRWRDLLDRQDSISRHACHDRYNRLASSSDSPQTVVVTAGIAANYYDEVRHQFGGEGGPVHLHIGYYPVQEDLIRQAAVGAGEVIVLEDGYPFLERIVKRTLGAAVSVRGREDRTIPADGELTTESALAAFSLPAPPVRLPSIEIPGRPPQFCRGCPHASSFTAIESVLSGRDSHIVTSDIGCYALGAMSPYHIVDSIVCMGASIGMAKGAAEAGASGVVATIGDSTFLHSGIPSLIDAVEAHASITVVILDNELVAMTGGQPTASPSSRIEAIVAACGVDGEHIKILDPLPKRAEENARIVEAEVEHEGVSVVLARRSCVTMRTPAREGTVDRRVASS